jgi:hypothetical protein
LRELYAGLGVFEGVGDGAFDLEEVNRLVMVLMAVD